MSVRNGLVALLAERPMGVYELRKEFDARTGGTWPLNIGQVYTTVQRLVRDGLVEPVPEEYEAGDVDPYRLTRAGYDEAESWWRRPVDRATPTRDELAIKLALAVTSPDVDVAAVVHAQRVESMRALRDYTRLKARLPERPSSGDLAWSLVLDSLVFAAEAEVRWLDHVEAAVARAELAHGASASDDSPGASDTPPVPRPATSRTRR
ncbi:DNA-binding PadR family transcriptional regulator [Salana multivorans]|uniref:DNA-binding PadR family transcriptional regulator n=1 Tax=Salana multivorans TaxID=120377 RepID=A0A3N2D8N7_9MICO|nr:PadR family transcriptional regulator [Salana multivorans]ROR95998.1 DNA-binding PadR family transcriptional regulator [Salana multivorans]